MRVTWEKTCDGSVGGRGVILALALFLAPATALAADWHVAPWGVDGEEGTEAAPLFSLAHALERSGAGDRILLERGGAYAAQNVTVSGGRTVAAYGVGADPVLTGSVEVVLDGTWAQNAAVRTGPMAERVVACYVDGRFVPRARYPNQGFLRIDNDDEHDRIVDAELAARPGVAAGRWTGAQVRWRKWSWWWETRPIAAHSAIDTLELDAEGRVDILISDPGSGYFIDGDLDELDAPGEWHWEGGTLYLYPPPWADPASMRVEVMTTARAAATPPHEDEAPGVVASGGARFEGIHFSRYYGVALRLTGPAEVEGCTFSELESTGINFTWSSQPFTVRRSVFRDVRNIAIQGWADGSGPAGSLIERNLFMRIGAEPGYGGNGPWHAAGVIVGNANAATVRLNRFVDTGYAGIILGSDGQTVERNLFVRAMRTLNDGAAIYTNCNASILRENIILDTIGDLEYSHPWWPLGHGIWPEFLEEFHDTEILHNTIYGSGGHGIFLPNNYNCTITGNVSVDNRRAAMGLFRHNEDAGFDSNQGHSIEDNVLAAVAPTRRIQRPENLNQWYLPPYSEPLPVALEYDTTVDYGLMTRTDFVAPLEGAGVIRAQPWGGGNAVGYDSLADWQAAAPGWADSTGSNLARAHAILLFNDTEAPALMAVPPGTWTLVDGSAVGASVTLQPFRSVVLVSSQAPPDTPPYHAASGVDWRAETPTTSVLSPDPEIAVFRGGQPITQGGADSVQGSAPGSATTLSYTLVNEGGAELLLDSPSAGLAPVSCSVEVSELPAGAVLPGSATSLVLRVTPEAAGDWSFGVSIQTNDPDENPAVWTVTGNAQEGGGDAGVSPDGGQVRPDGWIPTGDGGGGGDPGDKGCGCQTGGAERAAPFFALTWFLAILWRRRWR
ncbi:MAG: right-handed parallel beta-helix repeat-containing protein [Polyangia bacterium]|jgi:uncharacterized protein (TIGR03382 family)|nr:right-handed parallel beta-helix repeat-containing protein [Polyangia bacterium]